MLTTIGWEFDDMVVTAANPVDSAIRGDFLTIYRQTIVLFEVQNLTYHCLCAWVLVYM